MRVLVTGATGVLGRRAVPALVGAGHEVLGAVRAERGAADLKASGAEPVSLDLFAVPTLRRAMHGVEAVIHLATAMPPAAQMRRVDAWATNDLIRTEGTRNLVDAALATDVSRFVQASITFNYADGGHAWLDEDSPIDPPWVVTESALAAEAEVERFSRGGGHGVVLRLGRLYGTADASADFASMVSLRRAPVLGRGTNYVSSLHSDDAGTAVTAGLGAPGGVYNVVDDQPVTAPGACQSGRHG
jgi:nucleoside-diphosphate-sugar epimerase